MLSNPSQLLLRSQALFTKGRWLLVNPADADIFSELAGADVWGFHQFHDIYQSACRNGTESKQHFGAFYPRKPQVFDGIVIYMPKAKEHGALLIAQLAPLLNPGGQLLFVGEKKGGVSAAPKLTQHLGQHCNKLDAARHCMLFGLVPTQPVAPFEETDWLQTTSICVDGTELKVASLPGVFSFKELDPATRLLLENSGETLNQGRLLDFACGCGVIGAFLKKRSPKARVTLCDVSALATYCSAKTAELNALDLEVIAADGLNGVGGTFNAVYTNPPFHTGIKTDYSITEDFIARLPGVLSSGGHLRLVANGFLKYPSLIEASLGNCKTVTKNTKFAVYSATNHR